MDDKVIQNNRDSLLDIVKGIGIISVVLGHAFNTEVYYDTLVDNMRKFVYLYHLVIFIFCSGYYYKEREIKKFVRNKLIGIYVPFVFASIVSFVFYPILNILGVVEIRNFGLLSRLIGIFAIWKNGGFLTYATWFVPVLFWVCIIARLILGVVKCMKNRWILFFLLSIISLDLNYNKIELPGYINYILLFLPFFFLGIEAKRVILISKINCYIFIPACFIMVLCNNITGLEIEVTKGLFYGYFGFIPISVLGILFCISLAKFLDKTLFSQILAYIGRHSFYIMTFHFIGFKLFDGIISSILQSPKDVRVAFPISFPELRMLYCVVGIIFPLGLLTVNQFIKQKFYN